MLAISAFHLLFYSSAIAITHTSQRYSSFNSKLTIFSPACFLLHRRRAGR